MTLKNSRREFLSWAGRSLGAATLAGLAWRLLMTERPEAEFVQPDLRYAWKINPDKCRFCGKCAAACIRKPAAVKAVNDQKKCSNCVVCYGHIYDKNIDSDKIDSAARKVCPRGAVKRRNFTGGLDGYYIYNIDQALCIGCGHCALECNTHGTKSMFLLIRPDLCLNCNLCACEKACPYDAIERVHLGPAKDLRGDHS